MPARSTWLHRSYTISFLNVTMSAIDSNNLRQCDYYPAYLGNIQKSFPHLFWMNQLHTAWIRHFISSNLFIFISQVKLLVRAVSAAPSSHIFHAWHINRKMALLSIIPQVYGDWILLSFWYKWAMKAIIRNIFKQKCSWNIGIISRILWPLFWNGRETDWWEDCEKYGKY